MKAKQIYERAKTKGIKYIGNCASFNYRKVEELMDGSTKASGETIRKIIKTHYPDIYASLSLDFYNPHETWSRKKKDLLIYVHSSIEYFFKIN